MTPVVVTSRLVQYLCNPSAGPSRRSKKTALTHIRVVELANERIAWAGKLLGDQLMLDVGRDFVSRRLVDGTSFSYFGEDSQTFFVEETSANVINFGGGGYTPFDLGMPEWGVSHVEAPWNDNRSWSGNPYRVCCTVNAWVGHVLTAHVMGLVGDWHHAALFGYTDRYMTIEPLGWTRSWASWVETMWDTYRSQY